METVSKPWGHERWLHQGKYVLKEIFMKGGHRSSLQFHKVKEETNYILKGHGRLWGEREKVIDLFAGDVFTITPPTIHRVEAITDLTMIEASTPEVDDVIRIEDDFRRGDGRIESEHKN